MKRTKTTCLRCHRNLKDPKSVEREMGPICAVKGQVEKEDGQDMLMPPKSHNAVTQVSFPKSTDKVYLFSYPGDIKVLLPNRQYPLKHIIHHSPTGFAWGYGGSGPADTARSILWDLAGQKVADTFYQAFKWAFIAGAGIGKDGGEPEFVIEGQSILDWLRQAVTDKNQQEPQEALQF